MARPTDSSATGRAIQVASAGTSPAAAACVVLLAGCAGPGSGPPVTLAYPGEAEFYLEPYDAQGACSVTVGLRNLSGVRQGEGWFSLAWYGTDGSRLAEQELRLDPLLQGRYDAKNLSLPVKCAGIGRVVVQSARWRVFQPDGGAAGLAPEARIDGVDGQEWRFSWQPESGLFVGQVPRG